MVPFRGFFPCLLLIYLAFQIRNTSSALTGISTNDTELLHLEKTFAFYAGKKKNCFCLVC